MKKVQAFLAKIWLPSLIALGTVGLTFAVLFYKLGSLTPGLSEQEVASLQGIGSLRAIAEQPLFLPFKLGQYVILKLGLDLPIAIRGVSAMIGAVCVWGFYLLLKRWHTRRIAAAGTLLFLTSSWFLATARTATPDILYVFNTLSVIFIGALVYQKKASKTSLLLAAVCAALLVYSPGMIWLLGIGLIWQHKGILSLLRQNPVWLWVMSVALFGLLLVPAAYAVFLRQRYALEILAIPDPIVPLEILKRIAIVPKELFVQGPKGTFWLARLPILDIFSGAMFAVGIYHYYLRFKIARTTFLLWLSIVLIILLALFTLPTVVVLPLVFIVVTYGITLLMQQWLTVFPLNPIARNTGFAVMAIAILASCWFQSWRYFVAWRYSPVTQAAYHLKIDR